MNELDAITLNESQKTMLYPKKRRAKAIMNMDKFIGLKSAIYDKQLEQPHIKDYISEIICHCQRYIGKHRKMWWIINLLNKK